MIRRYALLFVLALLAASCAGGSRVAAKDAYKVNIDLSIEERDLPNGLHIVFHPDPSATRALVYIRYFVGSKDDPQGRSGFAHLFEHLMFRGSKYTAEKDHAEWIEEVGGVINAVTTLDTTDYYEDVPPNVVARALWLEADRMAHPLAALDETGFARERDVVKIELRESDEDVPLGNLASIALEAVFGSDHPYGTTTGGRMSELDSASLAEARAFASTFYRPNNATLVVCGRFDVATTRKLVAQYFEQIAPATLPPSRIIPPPKLKRPVRIPIAADVAAPTVAMAWAAPSPKDDGSGELAFGLHLVAGHLTRELVIDRKLANRVETQYLPGKLGGLVMLTVDLKPGASPDSVTSIIDDGVQVTARLARENVWEEFGDFKTRALVQEVSALEGLRGRAQRILHDLDLHGQPNAVQADLRKLQSIDSMDVGAALEHFLVDAPHVTMTVRPTPNAPRAGRRQAPR